ncbi:MAG: type II CAAX endopeptidase family protein [Fimbriimonadaceae bacterium]
MSELPPITEPSLDIPPVNDRRLWIGWIALGLILTFMIGMSVSSYFGRGEHKANFDEVDRQFGAHVGSLKLGIWPKGKPFLSAAELNDLKKKGAEGALYAVAYADLKGDAPNTNDFAAAANDKSKRFSAMVEIARAKSLNAQKAKEFGSRLGDSRLDDYFLNRAREKAGLSANWSRFERNASVIWIIASALLFCLVASPFIVALFRSMKSSAFMARGHYALPMTLVQADIFALRAAQLLTAFLTVSILAAATYSQGTSKGAWSIVGSVAALMTVLVLVRGRLFGVRTGIFRRSDSPRSAIPLGILIYVAGAPVIAFAAVVGVQIFSGLPAPEHGATTALASSDLLSTVAIIIGAVVVAPIVEEIIFRGLILPALHRLTGKAWVAIIITNLLFGAMHSTGIPAWAALAMIGVVNSIAVYQTGSLYPAMAMHALHNGVLVTMTLMSR